MASKCWIQPGWGPLTFSGSEKGVSNVVIKAMDEFPERKCWLENWIFIIECNFPH